MAAVHVSLTNKENTMSYISTLRQNCVENSEVSELKEESNLRKVLLTSGWNLRGFAPNFQLSKDG